MPINSKRIFMGIFRGQGAIESCFGTTAGALKGQGATEYLVLLAVVLIVALVSVALLGFFPGMASDARITQSQAYWKGQAKPFSIKDASLSNGAGTLSLQNMEASTITLTSIQVGSSAANATSLQFGPGEAKTVTLGSPNCTSGAVYEVNVSINYSTSSGIASRQYGTKTLVGKCV